MPRRKKKANARPSEAPKEQSGNTEPPSPEEVAELARDLERDSDWQKAKEQAAKFHDLYHNEHAVESIDRTDDMLVNPSDFIYRLGRAQELVDHMTGLKAVPVQYSLTPHGIGSTNQARADKIEAWANAVLGLIEWEQGDDADDRCMQEIDIFGMSGKEVFPLPESWRNSMPVREDYEEGRAGTTAFNKARKDFVEGTAPIPLAVWHIPAQSWYPIRDGRTILKSISIETVNVAWVQSKWGDVEELADENQMHEVKLINYLDENVRAFYLASQTHEPITMLEKWDHHMPMKNRAPAVLYEGVTTADQRPQFRWKSVLAPIYDSLVGMDYITSRRMLRTALNYLPSIIRHISQAGSINPVNQSNDQKDFILGGVTTLGPQEEDDLRAFEWLKLDQEAETQYTRHEERVERTVPAVLQGILGGQTPGYTFNQAATYALSRYEPVMDRIVQSDVEVMRLVFMALHAWEQISGEKKVWLRRRTDEGSEPLGLGWADVKDMLPLLAAKRDRKLPPDWLANLQAFKEAVEGPLQAPPEWAAREFLGIEDWRTAIFIPRLAYDMELQPPLLNKTQNEVFARLQVALDEQEGLTPTEALNEFDGQLPDGLTQALQQDAQMVPATVGTNGQRFNPRAGQKSQPGGPNLQTGDVALSGATQ